MLKEKRQILFDYKNVFEAINIQRENHGDTLIPDGEIVNVTESPKNPEDVIISLKSAQQSKSDKIYNVPMSEDLLIKGLCLFCVKHKIMFPQAGEKKLILKKGKVILSVFIDTNK